MPDRVVIAFKKPPDAWGFRPAKSGKSWWIRLDDARVDRCAAALIDLHIKFTVKDPRQTRVRVRRLGKAAKHANAAQREAANAEKAQAAYEAGVLWGRREIRAEREEAQRRMEIRRQAQKRAEAETERRAAAMLALARGETIRTA